MGVLGMVPGLGTRAGQVEVRVLEVLAAAGELVVTAPAVPDLISSVLGLLVPELASYAGVVLATDGALVDDEPLVRHEDPALARELASRWRPRAGVEHLGQTALATGEARVWNRVELAAMGEPGLRSLVAAPLGAPRGPLGVLLVASTARSFGDDDRAFVARLARLVGLAADKARQAEQACRRRDELLATVSHELRTPLTALLGWTSLLRRADVTAIERDRALSVIERNARAQARLLDDLLDVARINAGTLRIALATLELPPLAARVVESMRPMALERGVELVLVDDEPRLPPVLGDGARLEQVLVNLVSNALKFTDPGGLVRVGVRRAVDAEGQLELSVTDTGRGIEPALLPRIFEPFQQGAPATRPRGGLGIGLTIARHLVELHGGTLRALSDGAGRGATFVVRLPIAREEASAAGLASDGAVAPLPEPLSGLRVLVVEDEDDSRELVAAVLEAAGAEVSTAASSAEALSHLATHAPPSVIVSDIGMPEEDGYRFIEKALASSAAGLPALALTAYARAEDRRRALRAGFRTHLAKPVDPVELIEAIVELVTGQPGDGVV